MKRQRSILRSALLLVPVLATMGAVPRFAQAQSSGPADSVWVADDQTAQSNCTINGLPCAPGTVFYVHRVPLAAAQAAHKPYLAGTANSAEQDGFLESRRAQVRPAQTATVSPSIPGLSCTARPYTDAGQAYLNTIGSSVSESSTYYVDSWCNRFARSYSTSLVSGPLTYKNDTSRVYDSNGTQWDNDDQSANTCAPLTNTGTYHGYAITTTLPVHIWIHYSSGSNCTWFDTYYAVNWQWAQ